MSRGDLPFRYLGVPLSSKKLTIMQCQPLIKKILSRIECWISKLLTYAGRLQLIKSVLTSVQLYWCQIFLLPQKVLKIIQTACRSFLWTGSAGVTKRALVSWEYLCLPKVAGGWNLTRMIDWNKAAICKLLWSLAQKQDRIWVKWIHGYYIRGQELTTMKVPSQASWVVRKVIEAKDYLALLPDGARVLQAQTFSIKKVYKDLRGDVVRVPWKKTICNNRAPPKCVFIVWLTILGKLVTCDNLLKIGIQCDQVCVLCDRANESIAHLFFSCDFSANVWAKLQQWSKLKGRVQQWDQEMQHLVTQCRTNSGTQAVYRVMITLAVYFIWKERNMRKFQSKQSSVEEVVRQCQLHATISCRKDKKMASCLAN